MSFFNFKQALNLASLAQTKHALLRRETAGLFLAMIMDPVKQYRARNLDYQQVLLTYLEEGDGSLAGPSCVLSLNVAASCMGQETQGRIVFSLADSSAAPDDEWTDLIGGCVMTHFLRIDSDEFVTGVTSAFAFDGISQGVLPWRSPHGPA